MGAQLLILSMGDGIEIVVRNGDQEISNVELLLDGRPYTSFAGEDDLPEVIQAKHTAKITISGQYDMPKHAILRYKDIAGVIREVPRSIPE